MLVEDMFQRVLDEVGQFLLGRDDIELAYEPFLTLVRSALGTYNRKVPHVEIFEKRIDANQVTFTTADPFGIPDWIADVVPTNLYINTANNYSVLQQLNPMFAPEPQRKSLFPWAYRRPTLTVPYSGTMEITAVYRHGVTVAQTVDSREIHEVKSIGHDAEVFFDLLTGRFLLALGRSRRAFTLDNLPIKLDAGELVAEGQAKIEASDAAMNEKAQKMRLAWK